MKVSLPRAWNLSTKFGSHELRICFFNSFFVHEPQTSSCFMKVSLLRAWNLSWMFGSHELKFWFIFFIPCDWTSTLKLLYEGFIAKCLKSKPKAWLKCARILNISFFVCDWTSNLKLFLQMWAQGFAYMNKLLDIFFHTLWLNFKPQAAFTKVSLPRSWNLSPRLDSHELKFWNSFYNHLIELQTSTCFMKVWLPRAWNVSPRLGSNELKFWFIFFIQCDWISNLKLFYESLVVESLISEPEAWLTWVEILIFSFFHSL